MKSFACLDGVLRGCVDVAQEQMRALQRLDKFASKVQDRAGAIERAKERLAKRHQLSRLQHMRQELESQVASLVGERT